MTLKFEDDAHTLRTIDRSSELHGDPSQKSFLKRNSAENDEFLELDRCQLAL